MSEHKSSNIFVSNSKVILIAIIVSIFLCSNLFAWSTANGVAISTAASNQFFPQLVTDSAGGAIITWNDLRNGNSDIYVQRVNSGGTTLWTTNGVAICTSVGTQTAAMIVSDNNSGAIITWQDSRGSANDIYAQRVNSSGSTLWTLNGKAICTSANAQNIPRLIADGAGGAIITWQDARSSTGGNPNNDIYAQRVNSNGSTLWTLNGVAISTAAGFQTAPMIVSDGAGGAIITWQDARGANSDIYAQRVNSNGSTLWTLNGVAICTASGNQTIPVIITDNTTGAVITWQDARGSNSDIYAQRVNGTGSTLWTLNGVAISTVGNNQTTPVIATDGGNGAIICWQDTRSVDTNLYAQKVNGTGVVSWTANGVSVCLTTTIQHDQTIVADGLGGAVIVWHDHRSASPELGPVDIFAQNLDSTGNPYCTTDGIAICTAANRQQFPQVICDGNGYAIIVWNDQRTNNDIYAQSLYLGCAVTPPPPIVAGFFGSPTSGLGPLTVVFQDTSSSFPTSWVWTFGDGSTSTLENPSHTYLTVSAPTSYTVRLIASNAFGASTVTRVNYIFVTETSPGGNGTGQGFSANPTTGFAPYTVNFQDTTGGNPTSWNWTFGDGSTSTLQNPSHTYLAVSTPTSYTVRLIESNAFGTITTTKVNYIIVTEPAPGGNGTGLGFSANPTTGFGPLLVAFQDTTGGNPTSWSWNFGDGSTSNLQNPSHTYQTVSAATSYTVRLILSNAFGTTTVTKANYIVLTEPAPGGNGTGLGFSANPTTGFAPYTVNFQDTTGGNPTSWSWSFGDGSTSNIQNPSHQYQTVSAPTSYTVRLILSNAFGTTTVTKSNYIIVTEPAPGGNGTGLGFTANPTTGFAPYTVNFQDTTGGNPTSWSWSFGDGSTSNLQNPIHQYQTVSAPTSYTVRLILSNAFGTTTVTKVNYIVVTEPAPGGNGTGLGFTANPTTGFAPYTVNFQDTTGGSPTSWVWDFGDGGTDNTQNPSHQYQTVSSPTSYTVSLILSNNFGSATVTYVDFIHVTEPAPGANGTGLGFSANPTTGFAPYTVNFQDTTGGNPTSWAWDFGDGGTDNTQNPSHQYQTVSAPTSYTVSLILSNNFGSATVTYIDFIHVTEPAPGGNVTGLGFSANPTTGFAPYTVNFQDTTGGNPTSWAWNFGDGGTSNTQNPSHQYQTVSAPTSYTVSLILSNNFGSATVTYIDFIHVTEPAPGGNGTGLGFSANPTTGFAPYTVNFQDTTGGNPTSWAWDFGDGGTGNTQNPSHQYQTVSAPTSYTVSLILSNNFGSSTVSYVNLIHVTEPAPGGNGTGLGFIANPTTGFAPFNVNFQDTTGGNPTSWAWDFGDGGTSTAQNPTHQYQTVTATTSYTVTLILTNNFGSTTVTYLNIINVTEPAPGGNGTGLGFYGTPTSGFGPLNVNFVDTTGGNPTAWEWSFGDGSTSSEQNPQHTYASVTAPTYYSVTLVLSNNFGSSTVTNANYILVSDQAPDAGFYATPTGGNTPLSVNFTDTTGGNPTSWEWDFGDGTTSNLQNPTHVYDVVSQPTTYAVRLIASNVFGTTTSYGASGETTATDLITALPPAPYVGFYASPTSGNGPLSVNFTDTTGNDPTSWAWDFGDGGTSTTQNPNHVYSAVTADISYTVSLVASNAYGSSTATMANYITVTVQPLSLNTQLPDLKLFMNQSLPLAFDINDYIPEGSADTYSVVGNFLGLTSLTGSTVNEDSYSLATVGLNTYVASLNLSTNTVSNLVKYSTYKIQKLPKVGLSAGESWDVPINSYTSDSSGEAIPSSFGSPDALIVSDTSKISASWTDASTIHLTALDVISSPVSVDVIAAPVANAPYGVDQDKERFWVYSNLLSNGTFSTENDTTAYIAQSVPGYSNIPTLSWISSIADNAGTMASGVISNGFGDSSFGEKVTLQVPNWLNYSAGQWYTVRARVFSPDSANNHQFILYNYGGVPGSGHVDIAANGVFGIPNNWTWLETPIYSRVSAEGYLQYILKGSASGSAYIDEFQITPAAPILIDGLRSISRVNYAPGFFGNTSDATSGFAMEKLGAAQGLPQADVVNQKLQVDFNGASTGNILGMKMTASVGGLFGTIYTPFATLGKEVGTRASVSIQNGTFNSTNSLVLVAAYGVNSSNHYDFFNGGQIIASAEFGSISGSTTNPYRAIGRAFANYFQFQFQAKNDASGVLVADDIQLDRDMDDPNFGDSSLYPTN